MCVLGSAVLRSGEESPVSIFWGLAVAGVLGTAPTPADGGAGGTAEPAELADDLGPGEGEVDGLALVPGSELVEVPVLVLVAGPELAEDPEVPAHGVLVELLSLGVELEEPVPAPESEFLLELLSLTMVSAPSSVLVSHSSSLSVSAPSPGPMSIT